VWTFANRGFDTVLVAGADQFMLDAGCESCGQCVTYCPVGALWDKMSIGKGRLSQVEKVRTTCSYCGVGCNFDLNVRDNEIIRVTAAADAPVNGLSLCVKGHYGYDYVHHPDRLTRPMVRAKWLDDATLQENLARGAWESVSEAEKRRSMLTWQRAHGGNGNSEIRNPKSGISPDTFIRTDWDTALDVVARKFSRTKKDYGGDAFALMASAKCTNEENYIFNKFTRQMLATHSIDHCARL
jgi:formate dehydrogenase major subunit/formate dehydrogenase alpha subunit